MWDKTTAFISGMATGALWFLFLVWLHGYPTIAQQIKQCADIKFESNNCQEYIGIEKEIQEARRP